MSTHGGNEPPTAPSSARWPVWLPRAAPVALVGAFAVLGVVSVFVVPWDVTQGRLGERAPPDEAAHFAYVRHLATQHSLPVFDSANADYESHQPPLYYALGVIAYAAASWAGTGAAYYAIRLLSVAIGACLVYLVWVFMSRLFPDDAHLPVAATGMAAFLPMHVAILSAITNDGLAELVATAILYICFTGLASGFTGRRVVVVGALLGVGALVKIGCLLLAPVALLAMALRMRQTRYDVSRLLWQWGLCLVVCLVVCGWWLVRSTKLYGDPLAMGAFREMFLAEDAARATPEWFFRRGYSLATYVSVVVLWTWCSFWGVLGQANQFMPTWFYAVGAVLTLWAGVGCVRLCRRGLRGGTGMEAVQRHTLLLLGAALALVLIAFVQFNREFFQAQARYLFPAIAPIVCFFALGWRELVPGRLRPYVLGALVACLLGMSACALAPGLASDVLPWEH
ncbi:MAG: hypothetical protein PVH68_16165 [Armatimonadota bacterium]|jgi:hypothetical protein